MITLTRTGLLLTLSADTIPAQGSSDVPISFVNDPETYTGYTVQPLAGWYKNGCKQSAVCRYADDTIKVPAAAFQQNGEIMLAIALIDPADANHIEVTQPASAYVIPAPHDPTELPDEDTWQAAVDEFVTQVMQPYQTNIQSAIDTANAASQAANEAVSTANAAVSTANAASQTATNTSNTINQAIQNGDFIPDVSATAAQGAVGSQPTVSVSGTKEAPVFNFTIPESQPDLSDTLTAVNNGDESVITDITAGGDGGSEGVYVSTRKQIGGTNDPIDILALHAGDGVVFETETIGAAGRATTISAAAGIGYFISQDGESVTIGTYDEWVAAGKPAWPTS